MNIGKLRSSNEPDVGSMVISLDFELMWGVRDNANIADYIPNVLGAHTAIKKILDMFNVYDIKATWATVGLLFCENREHMRSILPSLGQQPSYVNSRLSVYSYMDEDKRLEMPDSLFFAPDLIKAIASQAGQEIATHTFSHYYCLEDGQTLEQFAFDIDAAKSVADSFGISLESIVFPRNQYNEKYIDVCRSKGIRYFRGNPLPLPYQARSKSTQSATVRMLRLLDSNVNLYGHQLVSSEALVEGNIRASRRLKPISKVHRFADGMHLRRIKNSMTDAAIKKQVFHLWWHPHNFGANTSENIFSLKSILDHYHYLNCETGFESHSMASLGNLVEKV